MSTVPKHSPLSLEDRHGDGASPNPSSLSGTSDTAAPGLHQTGGWPEILSTIQEAAAHNWGDDPALDVDAYLKRCEASMQLLARLRDGVLAAESAACLAADDARPWVAEVLRTLAGEVSRNVPGGEELVGVLNLVAGRVLGGAQ